jgi:hypothetical protein
MGGDVRHRCRLARRQCSELRWLGHPARRGIGLESRLACITPTHLTADPGPTEIDSVAGPAVTWLLIFEQMQHVLGAQECPISQQSVVFVRQRATTTDGDQPRIALFREDRHASIPTIHGRLEWVALPTSLANRRATANSHGDPSLGLTCGLVSAISELQSKLESPTK